MSGSSIPSAQRTGCVCADHAARPPSRSVGELRQERDVDHVAVRSVGQDQDAQQLAADVCAWVEPDVVALEHVNLAGARVLPLADDAPRTAPVDLDAGVALDL